jgi:hypothetical protein
MKKLCMIAIALLLMLPRRGRAARRAEMATAASRKHLMPRKRRLPHRRCRTADAALPL